MLAGACCLCLGNCFACVVGNSSFLFEPSLLVLYAFCPGSMCLHPTFYCIALVCNVFLFIYTELQCNHGRLVYCVVHACVPTPCPLQLCMAAHCCDLCFCVLYKQEDTPCDAKSLCVGICLGQFFGITCKYCCCWDLATFRSVSGVSCI